MPAWLNRAALAGRAVGRPQLIELATRINAHYRNNLPDNKGPLTISDYSKPVNIKKNFIRRLGL
jgi:hypothetical protein